MARSRIDLEGMDDGRVRHPHPRSRRYWYTQRIKPGFWSDTIRRRGAKDVQDQMEKVISDVARRLNAG